MVKILSVFWHGIAPDPLPPEFDSKDPGPSTFKAQVEFLAQRYHPITVWDFLDLIDGACSVSSYSKPPILLGFDDGFKSVIANALPILTQLGVPAVFFVVAGVIENPHFIPWFVQRRYVIRRTGRKRIMYQGISLDLASPQDRERAHRLSERAFRGATCEQEREAVLTGFAEALGVPRPGVEDLDCDLRFIADEDLRQLNQSSILAVASHATTHRHLGDLGLVEQQDELRRSDAILRRYGSYCPVIAYPAGSFDSTTTSLAQEIYRAGFAVSSGASFGNPYAYPRVGLGRQTQRDLAYTLSPMRLRILVPLKKWLRGSPFPRHPA